jgi:flagellar M-ring protein FliF
VNGFQGFLKSMGMGRLIGITVGGLVSFALVYFLMAQMGGAPMMLLMSGLDEQASLQIQQELDGQNVKYETQAGGSIIMVEEEHARRLRMQFTKDGVASGSIVGYEIFDKTETLGSTSFVQNINRVRALEGELARTIMSINTIESARVHLTIAKRELFQRDKEAAKATVVIRSRGGRPDLSTVRAIQHIVANSVAGLSPSSVTIADETGGLLASGNSETGKAFGSNTSIDEKVHGLEERTRQKVYEILSGVIPIGKARVQVQADVERNRITEQSSIYDPDGQVAQVYEVSEKIRELTDSEEAPKGVSVANALPGGNIDGTVEGAEATTVDSDTDNFEKTTYLNSLTQRTSVIEPGEIKRMSIAVSVDGNYTVAADGTKTYSRRTDEELEQLTRLIKGAVGFNEARGDLIEVISMEFAAIEVPDAIADAGGMIGLSNGQLVEISKTLIIGIIVLLLTVLVIRPLMKAVLTPIPGGQLALAGGGAVGPDGTVIAALPGQEIAGQIPPPADASADGQYQSPSVTKSLGSQIDIAQIDGDVQGSSLKKVGEIVEKHPDESVAIIRNWLHNEE